MGDTKIEWTERTWNPVTGCTKVSQGCKNCYADRLAPKVFAGQTVPAGDGTLRKRVFTDVDVHPDRFEAPLSWKKPRRVFVNSMSDLFHEAVSWEKLDILFAVMALADRHTFQILTKRPRRMYDYFAGRPEFSPSQHVESRVARRVREIALRSDKVDASKWEFGWRWPLRNVWLGVSVEDQETAHVRINHLLSTPAAVRFLSCEPLLGPINLVPYVFRVKNVLGDDPGGDIIEQIPLLHWVIAGGESGPHARPAHPDWFRSLRDQCAESRVAYFFKQWGEWAWRETWGESTGQKKHYFDDGLWVQKVGKQAAGRILDGREHSEYPA